MNNASSSMSGTLPSNTITNPKDDLKGITTRSGNLYQGPTIPTTSSFLPKVAEHETEVTKDIVPPTNNGSTKYIQPLVVQVKTLILNSEPIVAPIIKLVVAPCLALADLGASINLMPLSVWNKLSLPELSPTCMTLELMDRSISRLVGVTEDVFVKVGTFHFLAGFVVVDFDGDLQVPLILERSFLKTEKALIDVYEGELTLRVDKEAVTFNLDQTSRYSANYNDITANRINVIDMACEEYSQEVFGFFDVIASSNPTLIMTQSFLPLLQLSLPSGIAIFFSKKSTLSSLLKMIQLHRKFITLIMTRRGTFFFLKHFLIMIHHYLLPLKETTHKDHFPLLFMDQMLKRLAGNEYYCFLDGFSGYFQIPIDPKDQEKTTFTCPYGTYSYRRMPFGLCNAPVTFQMCMMAIFHDMIEKRWKSSWTTSWSLGIHSELISPIWKRCLSDKAKVDVIAMLPHPTTVKGICSFLGHVSFYRRFIQDFSKIARPMTCLLEKDTPFFLSKEKPLTFSRLDTMDPLEDILAQTTAPKRFGTPHAIISDRGTYFYNDQFTKVMLKYGVTNRLATAYHPQTGGQTASDHHKVQLNELNELRDQAYENSLIYKEKTKRLHDLKIKDRVFNVDDRVLLFNSRLKIFLGKLKTRWSGPFTIIQVFPYGTIELF
nr:DNA-directed DNA polymerase [Tanacetum cinerariifolium]